MLLADPHTNSYTVSMSNSQPVSGSSSAQLGAEQSRTEIAAADFNLSNESFSYIAQQISSDLEQNTQQTLSAVDFNLEEVSFTVNFDQLVEPTLNQSVDVTPAQESVEFSEAGFSELMTNFRAEPVAGINTEHLVAELGGILEGALTMAAFAPAAAAVINNTRDAITGEQTSAELYPELNNTIAA